MEKAMNVEQKNPASVLSGCSFFMSSAVLCDSVQGSQCGLHLTQHNLKKKKKKIKKHFLFIFLITCTKKPPSEPFK